MTRLIYCIDIDGVVCRTEGMKYGGAEPRWGVIERINALFDAGHRVILDTARGSVTGIDWKPLTEKQLAMWGVKYHELRCGEKVPADKYIDDRAVNVEDWLAEGFTDEEAA